MDIGSGGPEFKELQAFLSHLAGIGVEGLHIITADNGKKVAHHEKISAALSTDVYFVHPYSSWERGLNPREDTNRFLRQYFPKNTDLNLRVYMGQPWFMLALKISEIKG